MFLSELRQKGFMLKKDSEFWLDFEPIEVIDDIGLKPSKSNHKELKTTIILADGKRVNANINFLIKKLGNTAEGHLAAPLE